MSTPLPTLIDLDGHISRPISEACRRLRNRYLYDDIKDGETADYFEALEQFSAKISAISEQRFEEIRGRRGVTDQAASHKAPPANNKYENKNTYNAICQKTNIHRCSNQRDS